MVETFKNCFSPASNEGLVGKSIKWNHSNYSCIIFNVDGSGIDSFIRFGFRGIIKNTFDHYFAGFSSFIQWSSNILLVELYTIYKNILMAKDINIDEII
ncbi:hypothetical protein QL285_013842 [Trifolium repens]|nr:hypothetical protein QL285_013842 [Trifolium repens]